MDICLQIACLGDIFLFLDTYKGQMVGGQDMSAVGKILDKICKNTPL